MLKKVSLLVVLALILLVGAVIAAQPAEDGSVAWQSAERVDDQVTPKIYDVFLCAAICAWGGLHHTRHVTGMHMRGRTGLLSILQVSSEPVVDVLGAMLLRH